MTREDLDLAASPGIGRRRARISRLELGLAAVAVLVMAGLVLAEDDILEAPFENWRTMLLTFGGTALAAGALAAMLALRVPPLIRVLVLGIPLVLVSWWLISPFFIDDEVDEGFSTTIAAAASPTTPTTPRAVDPAPPAASPAGATTPTTVAATTTSPSTTAAPAGPVLLASGTLTGLAGHDGTGQAGIFRTGPGAHVLRLEDLDIDNGPDLRLYVVPGGGQLHPAEGSVYLGPLRGNVGNLTYDLPADFSPTSGDWTVLVWCEAFDVEFVGATLTVA